MSTHRPFRAMPGFLIDLMLDRLTPEHIGIGLGLQLFWLVALFGGVQLFWQRGLRRYSAVGAENEIAAIMPVTFLSRRRFYQR